MKQASCARCGGTFPLGSMYSVQSEQLCKGCVKQELAREDGKALPAGSVVPLLDLTVCSKCGKDNGETAFEQVAGLPLCGPCEGTLRNYPFPGWVKASAAALVAVAVISFALNWRFFKGYIQSLEAGRAAEQGQFGDAAALMTEASLRVPESQELSFLASYFGAAHLLQEDKDAEAVPLLQKCLRIAPREQHLEMLLAQARIGAAFAAKDYDAFLELANEMLEKLPDSPASLGQVASAHACKYAATGDEESKKQALEYLDRAGKAAARTGATDFKEYAERIRHRIETREILSKKEYDLKYRKASEPKGE